LKTAKTILRYIWTAIAVVVMAFIYAFFTRTDNKELQKAEKKVHEREKAVEKAKKEYKLSKEKVKDVRNETDRMLAEMEVEDVTEEEARYAVERAIDNTD